MKYPLKRYALLPIRIVILFPFFALYVVGEWAHEVGRKIDRSRWCPKGLDG